MRQLSQFVSQPCLHRWDAAIHVLKHLKGCSSLSLFFFPMNDKLTLTAYSNVDWGACVDTRRSLTGYCAFLGGS